MNKEITLNPRSQELRVDERGYNYWHVMETPKTVKTSEMALILCDVWDKHWSRAATERVAVLAPQIAKVVDAARDKGIMIIHAPSDNMDFYKEFPARQRMIDTPRVELPKEIPHANPPQPCDSSDGGSDTNDQVFHFAWHRQHESIHIDDEKDGISEDGEECYSYMKNHGIKTVVIMGIHTNMCILGRSYTICQMVRWGMDVIFVGDLTDANYNPALPPYVPHDEGTRLTVEFIEKFWCPTIQSKELLK